MSWYLIEHSQLLLIGIEARPNCKFWFSQNVELGISIVDISTFTKFSMYQFSSMYIIYFSIFIEN